MPKRGDRVAPPPAAGEWDLRFGDNAAADGWEQLSRTAPGPSRTAWTILRTAPRRRGERQHPLKGDVFSMIWTNNGSKDHTNRYHIYATN